MKTDPAELLRAGLRAASLRQTVIANNIANLNTPGFRRSEVEFESLLADALRSAAGTSPAAVTPLVVQPRRDPIGPNGNDVNLDMEVGEMIKNSARFKVFFKLLGKYSTQIERAIGAE